MELFKNELSDMKTADLIEQDEKKVGKVKCVQVCAFIAMAFTIAELIVRAIIKDFIIGHCIFVGELAIVGSLMLYFTTRFSTLVEDV